MTKLTRRELLTGAVVTAGVVGAVGVDLTPIQPVSTPETDLQPLPFVPAFTILARVPDLMELYRWEALYKRRYQNQMGPGRGFPRPQGPGGWSQTDVDEQEYDATTMDAAMRTLARLEAEVPAEVQVDDIAIAMARGQGFSGRRDGKPATANPFYANHGDRETSAHYDLYMSWFAGWHQADPEVKVARMAGYTPPPADCCQGCGQKWKERHRSGCQWVRLEGNSPVLKRQTRLKT